MNPEKIMKLIESGTQGTDAATDYRDVKIVSLAKKCRALNLSLMKERSALDKKSAESDEYQKQCETLRQEIVYPRSVICDICNSWSNILTFAKTGTVVFSGCKGSSN